MKFLIVTSNSNNELEFSPGQSEVLNEFCRSKRHAKSSKCNEFYKHQFAQHQIDTKKPTCCPYGLYCMGPLHWTEDVKFASALFFKDMNCPPELKDYTESTTQDKVIEYLQDIDSIAITVHQQSYNDLESAIHDIRHLNADITAHSERLLTELGYADNEDWDKQKLYSQPNDRRTLSIYCASRDISAALTMYEIAIDPNRAKDDVIPTNIHKLFYRQKHINLEKLEAKNLTVQLDNTNMSKNLTKSFSLVPIILLNNAIKYSQSNSQIKIDFIDSGGIFRIVCTNTGPVVRPDEIESVFLKHIRGSNKSGVQGHGIGLWLASLIVTTNFGTIKMHVKETGRDYSGRRIGETSVTVRLV